MKWSSGVERWNQPIEDVESINIGDIDAARFRTEYVDQCKPLLVRAATEHWPAASRWGNPDYLASKLGDQTFVAHREPVLENRWRKSHWPDRFSTAFETQPYSVLSYAELADLAASGDIIFSYDVTISRTSKLSAIHDDIGEFPILRKPGRPHSYQRLRAFLHGRSFTDWHCHPDDETLMCQFGRSKTVHMLPPDQSTWDVMFGIAERENLIGPADPERYPGLKTLKPRAALVCPGDALYIPPNWWHAVECTDQSNRLGITAAYCWSSPLHIRTDPRFPKHGFYLRHGRLKRRLQLAAAAVIWGALAVAGRTLEEIPHPP